MIGPDTGRPWPDQVSTKMRRTSEQMLSRSGRLPGCRKETGSATRCGERDRRRECPRGLCKRGPARAVPGCAGQERAEPARQLLAGYTPGRAHRDEHDADHGLPKPAS
jgi:hypothetical protein